MIKLFVVGFPREMSEIELDELLTAHGMVKKITIIRDLQTQISKGYAFVDMMDRPGADRAISALNGFSMGMRTISVRLVENRSQEQDAKSNDVASGQIKRSLIAGPQSKQNGEQNKKRPRRHQIG